MHFSSTAVDLARQLKSAGLDWTPAVGHFVWDDDALIEAASPFHDRVYFILDMKHFLRRWHTPQRLAAGCTWLPTWDQARQRLRQLGVDDRDVQRHVMASDAIARGAELEELYRLILSHLKIG